MDKVMAFLMQYLTKFFDWWEGLYDWPVLKNDKGEVVVKWSFVALWVVSCIIIGVLDRIIFHW